MVCGDQGMRPCFHRRSTFVFSDHGASDQITEIEEGRGEKNLFLGRMRYLKLGNWNVLLLFNPLGIRCGGIPRDQVC